MASDPAIETDDDDAPLAAPGKLRAEAVKRLQIGLAGLLAMLLLVSLASIIQDRREQSDLTTVPDISASVAAGGSETAPNKDPLADAGVVPELPAEIQCADRRSAIRQCLAAALEYLLPRWC